MDFLRFLTAIDGFFKLNWIRKQILHLDIFLPVDRDLTTKVRYQRTVEADLTKTRK